MMLDKLAKNILLDVNYEPELSDFIGEHYLSCVQFDGNDIIFVLDNIAFIAIENPSDGYRSALDGCKIFTGTIDAKNIFPPVKVSVTQDVEILDFIDIITKKVVMKIGTDESDTYYPIFLNKWYPENLYLNNGGSMKGS